MKKLLMLSVAFVTFSMPQAFAQEEKQTRGGKMFEETDTNNDGIISKEEFKVHHEQKMEEWFAKLDTNGDGKITEAEVKDGKAKMRERMKQKVEQNQEKAGESAPAETPAEPPAETPVEAPAADAPASE